MGRKIQRNLIPAPLVGCLAGAVAILLSGCGQDSSPEPSGPASDSGKPQVFTVNYPLAYFAEQIGGEAIEVVFPAPADCDPAFWEPSENEIAAFQSADLILLNGATYAKWLATASLPESIQVNTSSAFEDKLITIHSSGSHSHGADGEHSHDGVAFTTWLDLGQAIQQAKAIHEALSDLLPDSKASFDANLASLQADLEKLDADLGFAAQGLGDRPVVASHPVYQYLARRYGLRIRSVLWEPETVPDDDAMGDLKALLEKHPAKLMLWEGEPAAESVKNLEAIGVKSFVFDPCGNRPGEGEDFLSVMKANLEQVGQASELAP